MKLTTTTFASVDGVMQGIGAPDEDRRGGFERGGWTDPYFDKETEAFLNQVYQPAAGLLLDIVVRCVIGDVAVDQPLARTLRLPDDVVTLSWTDIDPVPQNAVTTRWFMAAIA